MNKQQTPLEKIIHVTTTFGMSGKKSAEAMGISYASFRDKKSDMNRHFTHDNFDKLINWIKENAKKL